MLLDDFQVSKYLFLEVVYRDTLYIRIIVNMYNMYNLMADVVKRPTVIKVTDLAHLQRSNIPCSVMTQRTIEYMYHGTYNRW